MSSENRQQTQPPSPEKSASEASYRTLKPVADAAPKPAPAAKQPVASAKPGTGPKPEAAKETTHPDPTRFGDWEVKGRCIDF